MYDCRLARTASSRSIPRCRMKHLSASKKRFDTVWANPGLRIAGEPHFADKQAQRRNTRAGSRTGRDHVNPGVLRHALRDIRGRSCRPVFRRYPLAQS